MEGLCQYSVSRIQRVIDMTTAEEPDWTSEAVAELCGAATLAFTTTVDTDMGMRDAIASLVRCNLARLEATDFKQYLRSNLPELSSKLLFDVTEEMAKMKCCCSGGHDHDDSLSSW